MTGVSVLAAAGGSSPSTAAAASTGVLSSSSGSSRSGSSRSSSSSSSSLHFSLRRLDRHLMLSSVSRRWGVGRGGGGVDIEVQS